MRSGLTSHLFDVMALVAMATMGQLSADDDVDDDYHHHHPFVTTTASPDVINNHDVIAAARCRVRCLSLLKSSIDMTLLSTVKEMTSLVRCLQDSDCSSCMKPCNQPLLAVDRCEENCKSPREDVVCSGSCSFLREMKQKGASALGACPPIPSTLNRPNASRGGGGVGGGGGGGEPCVGTGRNCVSDLNCDQGYMCCATYCGMHCRRPVPPSPQVFPSIPQTPSLKEKTKGGSVELRWNSVVENGTGPVLYIVDSRWNIGKHHSEVEMTHWHQVTQTTGTTTVINEVTPGHWYQFRVTAVNIRGTRGGSAPTPAFTLSKEPRKPGPPTNLTEGDTLIAGGKMTVTIRWFPPKKSDIPVTRYKLFWSKRLRPNGGSQAAENPEFRKVLPGNRLTHQMQDLASDTTYIVQVQAICQFGDEKLKSEKSSIYITTYPLPHPSDDHYGAGGMGGVAGGGGGMPSESAVGGAGGGGGGRGGQQQPHPHPTPPPVTGLLVEKPFYDNGSLKANVTWNNRNDEEVTGRKFLLHWSPEACIADSAVSDDSLSKVMSATTSENSFLIYDLRTDCRYLVKVESVTSQGVSGKAVLTSFSTPACGQPQTSTSKLHPDCLINAPRAPEGPPDLTHSFLISNSNINSKLSWGIPASESPIVGYRVVWGPVVRSHQNHLLMSIDKSQTTVKVLTKDVRSLSMSNLQEMTNYLVQVQAITKFGQGQISSIQFVTPLLQIAPIDHQPYREVDKKQESIKRRTSVILNATAIMMTTTTTIQRTDRRLIRPPQTLGSLGSKVNNTCWLLTIVCLCFSLHRLLMTSDLFCFIRFRL